MSEYTKMAKDFCEKTGTEITFKYKGTIDHFPNEDNPKYKGLRHQWLVCIERGVHKWSFTFTNSIKDYEDSCIFDVCAKHQFGKNYKRLATPIRIKPVAPSEYDVLACITKYDVGDFDDFCAEFGYEFNTEREYIKVKQIYFDIMDEYHSVHRLFNDVIDELQEIC